MVDDLIKNVGLVAGYRRLLTSQQKVLVYLALNFVVEME
jgi:hypothetical protein